MEARSDGNASHGVPNRYTDPGELKTSTMTGERHQTPGELNNTRGQSSRQHHDLSPKPTHPYETIDGPERSFGQENTKTEHHFDNGAFEPDYQREGIYEEPVYFDHVARKAKINTRQRTALFLTFLVASAGLILSILVIVGVIPIAGLTSKRDEVPTARPTVDVQLPLERLEARISDLERGYKSLFDMVEEGIFNLTSQLDEIQEIKKELQNVSKKMEENKEEIIEVMEKTEMNAIKVDDITLQISDLSNNVNSTDIIHRQQINDLYQITLESDILISDLQSNVSIIESMLTNTVTYMNSSIYQELDTISKMPGPRGYNGSQGEKGDPGPAGPPGAGNLTACTYELATAQGSVANTIETPWIPKPDLEDYTVMGVTCSTVGGEAMYLKTQPATTGGHTQYQCECSGHSTAVTPSPGQKECNIHYWVCPSTI